MIFVSFLAYLGRGIDILVLSGVSTWQQMRFFLLFVEVGWKHQTSQKEEIVVRPTLRYGTDRNLFLNPVSTFYYWSAP